MTEQTKWWTIKTYYKKSCEQIEYFRNRSNDGVVTVRDGYRYAKAGIILNELVPQGMGQGNLFHSLPSPKNRAVMRVMDTLNKRMGRGTVYQASIGTKRNWALRADYRSPLYTSRWEDLPKARCN